MKKYSLIIGLILSLALTGCKNNGVPKKEKYSNEVTHEEFDAGFDKVLGDDADIFEEVEEGKGPSFKSVTKVTSNGTNIWKDNSNKQLGKGTNKIELTQNGQYDGKNDISKVTTKGESSLVIELGEEKQNEKVSVDYTRQYQVEKVGEVSTTYSVNQKDKEYYTSSSEPAGQCMSYLALPILFYAFGTAGWDTTMKAEEKAKWHFYIDNEVLFTATYKSTQTKELTHYVDSNNVKYADFVDVEEILLQMKIIKQKDAFKGLTVYFEMNGSETTTFCDTYEDEDLGITFHAYEVYAEESEAVVATRLDLTKVSLSAIDLSSYTLKEEDTEAKASPMSL